MAKRAAENASSQDGKWSRHRMSVSTSQFAKELSLAAAAQAKVDAQNKQLESEPPGAGLGGGSFATDKELEALVEKENEMRVEGYEYSSPFAIAREYMESHQEVASVL